MKHLINGLISSILALGTAAYGQTIDDLHSAAPDVAFGLAYSIGSEPPVIQTLGPLWRGATEQVTPDARWHIGSITKPLTSTLVMQQVDRGVLDLDAPVGTYLKRFDEMHPNWQSLTLRQLLSHTSGLPANPPDNYFFATPELGSAQERLTILSDLWATSPDDEPGEHLYSNLGYMFAGLVLEEITGNQWENLIRDNIATPLGLSSLGFGAPSGRHDPHGHRHGLLQRSTPLSPDSPEADNPAWIGPAGTVHMSLADLLTFGRAHLDACAGKRPDFLLQSSCQTMQTPVTHDYGLGWIIQNGNVWHNGSNTLWYALLVLDPQNDTVIAAVQNTSRKTGRIDGIVRSIVTR